MWYGTNSPAHDRSAYQQHDLLDERRPRGRVNMNTTRFNWAPLEEPGMKRRQLQQYLPHKRPVGKSVSLPDLHPKMHTTASGPLIAAATATLLPGLGLHKGRGLGGQELAPKVPVPAPAKRKGILREVTLPALVPASAGLHLSDPIVDVREYEADSDGDDPAQAPPPVPEHVLRHSRASRARTSEFVRNERGFQGKLARHFQGKLESRGTGYWQALLLGDKWGEGEGRFSQSSGMAAQRMYAAFACISVNREVSVGPELVKALLLLGHPYPDGRFLRSVIDNECRGRANLDEGDFVRVATAYESNLKRQVAQSFSSFGGKNQMVKRERLPEMLAELGVPLMAGAGPELVAESKSEIDKASFQRIYDDVLARAGLTNSESERLREAFERNECSSEGVIQGEQVLKELQWHEYLTSLAGGEFYVKALAAEAVRRTASGEVELDLVRWEALVAKASAGKEAVNDTWRKVAKDQVTGPAFLAAARVLHERIANALRGLLTHIGAVATKGRVPKSALVPLLEEVGFFSVLPSSVEEFLPPGMRGAQEHADLDFGDVYALVLRYCRADGITEAEGADLKQVFDRFDEDKSGTLETGELGPVIRWLGYMPTAYRIYNFAEEFGLTDTSAVDLREFRNLVAKYVQMSLASARKQFANSKGNTTKRLPVDEIDNLLHSIGYDPTEEEVEMLIEQAGGKSGTINFVEFKRLELFYRKHVRKTMEQNHGVTNAELARYKGYFHEHDRGTGVITQKGIRQLLATLFPDTSLSRERHVRIAQLVRESDADGNGSFDFNEYLWLVRKVTEDLDRDSLLRGLRLKEELGYSSAEVKQFRDLYMVADRNMSGAIDTDEMVSLFAHLVPMHGEAARQLRAMFTEVDDGDGELDFWEFLSFMRMIQDTNWNNINGR